MTIEANLDISNLHAFDYYLTNAYATSTELQVRNKKTRVSQSFPARNLSTGDRSYYHSLLRSRAGTNTVTNLNFVPTDADNAHLKGKFPSFVVGDIRSFAINADAAYNGEILFGFYYADWEYNFRSPRNVQAEIRIHLEKLARDQFKIYCLAFGVWLEANREEGDLLPPPLYFYEQSKLIADLPAVHSYVGPMMTTYSRRTLQDGVYIPFWILCELYAMTMKKTIVPRSPEECLSEIDSCMKSEKILPLWRPSKKE